MYYKVMKNNKVIDVLDSLIYLKWQPKHKIMVLTDENFAEAILSSSKDDIWHVKGFYKIPVDEPKFETVEIEEINKFEFEQLRMLNGKTPEQIADELILDLINSGII